MTANIIITIFGAIVATLAAYIAWVRQTAITDRKARDASVEAKLDALASLPQLVTQIGKDVKEVADGLNKHLIDASADHALLINHLTSSVH